MANFDVIGTLKLNPVDSKMPFVRSGVAKTGKKWMGFNGTVVVDQNNRMFVEVMGNEQDTIKTINSDREKIEAPWSKRKDPDFIKTLMISYFVKIGEDRVYFSNQYDLVDYLVEHEEEIKDKIVRVRGRVTKNVYKGKVTDRFEIQNLTVLDEEAKCSAKVSMDFFYNKDSIDFSEWKDSKKISIDGYTYDYISKDDGNKYVARNVVFDCSKLDFSNEKHMKLLEFKLSQLGIDFNGEKLSTKLKSTKYYKMGIVCKYYNGNQEVEFDESQLTKNQKVAIELGLKTLDDFKPKGSLYGNRVTLFNLFDFDLTKYADGFEIAEDNADDFEENIFVAPQVETVADVEAKAEAAASKVEEEEVSDEDLFG